MDFLYRTRENEICGQRARQGEILKLAQTLIRGGDAVERFEEVELKGMRGHVMVGKREGKHREEQMSCSR